MPHHLARARFRRMLSLPAPDGMLGLARVAMLAEAAGLSLLQASVLLDEDPCWQRLFLDEHGCAVAALGAHGDCSTTDPSEVAWRRLAGTRRTLAA